MDIYCVKIRQRRLNDRKYFPFERMYIVPNEFFENDYWKQVFPYMLVAESPHALIEKLSAVGCDLTLIADPESKPKKEKEFRRSGHRSVGTSLRKVLPDLVGHRIVIPTYKYRKALGYLWSYLKGAELPGLELSLYTPKHIIPSMCYQCINLSHKYAGECSLTDGRCRSLVKLDLPKQEGDTECQSDSVKRPSQESNSAPASQPR